eukprot:4277031-Pyramimonas_sp.AAC.1
MGSSAWNLHAHSTALQASWGTSVSGFERAPRPWMGTSALEFTVNTYSKDPRQGYKGLGKPR